MATPRKRPEDKKKTGRPTDYNEDIAALICERVATSTMGLDRLCVMYDDMPVKSTVNLWRYKHPEFSTAYAQAKLFQADLLAEECLGIADDSTNDTVINEHGFEACNTEWINRCRLRIDTRKWLAAKLLPKQYGKAAEEAPKEKSTSETLVEKLLDRLIE
jgi:hypothetical protein